MAQKQRPASAAGASRSSGDGKLTLRRKKQRPASAIGTPASTFGTPAPTLTLKEYKSRAWSATQRQRPMSAKESAPIVLKNLQQLDEEYSTKLATVRRQARLLNKEIKQARSQVVAHRRQLKRGGNHKENVARIGRHKITLENRLQKATTSVNTRRHQNDVRKGTIDELRKNQLILRSRYARIQTSVNKCKDNQKDVKDHLHEGRHELKHLNHAIEKIKKQIKDAGQEFINVYTADGAQTRKTIDDEYKRFKSRLVKASGGVLDKKQENRLKFENVRSKWRQAEKKAMFGNVQERLQLYAEKFAEIQAATGVKDLDDLVAKYSVIKERQYDVLLHVNALDVEKKHAEEKVTELEQSVRKARETLMNDESAKNRVLQKVSEKLKVATEQEQIYMENYKQEQKVVTRLKDLVERIWCAVDTEEARAERERLQNLEEKQEEEFQDSAFPKKSKLRASMKLKRMKSKMKKAEKSDAEEKAAAKADDPTSSIIQQAIENAAAAAAAAAQEDTTRGQDEIAEEQPAIEGMIEGMAEEIDGREGGDGDREPTRKRLSQGQLSVLRMRSMKTILGTEDARQLNGRMIQQEGAGEDSATKAPAASNNTNSAFGAFQVDVDGVLQPREPVNEFNMIQYLGIVEQRAQEMRQLLHVLQQLREKEEALKAEGGVQERPRTSGMEEKMGSTTAQDRLKRMAMSRSQSEVEQPRSQPKKKRTKKLKFQLSRGTSASAGPSTPFRPSAESRQLVVLPPSQKQVRTMFAEVQKGTAGGDEEEEGDDDEDYELNFATSKIDDIEHLQRHGKALLVTTSSDPALPDLSVAVDDANSILANQAAGALKDSNGSKKRWSSKNRSAPGGKQSNTKGSLRTRNQARNQSDAVENRRKRGRGKPGS